MDIEKTAKSLHEELSEHADISLDEIEERLHKLINEFDVPEGEAKRSVTRYFSKQHDISMDEVATDTDSITNIADIKQPDQWINIEAQVVEIWDSMSDAVSQTGLIGDETSTIKFTSWQKSDLQELEEGKTYKLNNVVSDEFQQRLSVNLNKSTEIEEIDKEIEVGSQDIEVEGALVAIQSGSGLIKRCPEEDCTRVLQNGRCSEHGEVEGEFDLRIKTVIDDGNTVHDVLFNREATEELTDITLEEAKNDAMDALDTSIVTDRIKEKILGRYYRVKGPQIGRYVLVEEAELIQESPDTDDLLMKVRSIE